MLVLWAALAFTDAADASSAALAAAAAASSRPPECSSDARRGNLRGPTIWELARVPELGRYCDLVAKAHALLRTDPKGALELALQADAVMPGRAAPAVLAARVALAEGRLDDADAAFERARKADPRSVADPTTMHDRARLLKRLGRTAEAMGVYRVLVPRVALLANPDREVAVLLEAAHLSMAVVGDAATPENPVSSASLDEALAYLREARTKPATQYRGDVLWSLALIVDRADQKENADALLREAAQTGARLRVDSLDYAAHASDIDALGALAAELADRASAVSRWEAFLASADGKGPWAKAAKRRLDALRRDAPKAPKARP